MKKSNWETETCTRCGGTGKYSSHILYGRRCFKCGGAKITLTRRGKAAHKYYHESLRTDPSKVRVGDYLFADMKNGWFKVKEITIEFDRFEFKCEGGYNLGSKYPVKSTTGQEELNEKVAKAQEYQSKLGKHGKVLKKYIEVA